MLENQNKNFKRIFESLSNYANENNYYAIYQTLNIVYLK